jgi:hypothetical protein
MCGHASAVNTTSHFDSLSWAMAGGSIPQRRRSKARRRPLESRLRCALPFRFLLPVQLWPISSPLCLLSGGLCRHYWQKIPVRDARHGALAPPPPNERHPKLLHPSADDSKIFDRYLNGMSQKGKCLVNAPCDSWLMAFSGAVESVKGSRSR